MSALIIFIVIFLLLSAFFSGSEIAFISANKLGVEVEKDRGSRKGKILTRFYGDPKEFLGTMLVGNNIALVVFTTLMTDLLRPKLEPSFGQDFGFLLVSTILVTFVVLLFGEFLPKVFFRLFANEIMSWMVYPLAFFRWLLSAPTWLMTKLSNFLLKYVLRTSIDATEDAITRLDLQDFVEGTVSQEYDEIETDMFKNALHLKNVRIDDCMVPRTEIEAVDVSASVKEMADVFTDTGHSRLVITDGDLDHVLGYVHHQELLRNPKSIKKAMRKITFVPETMSAKDLMIRMIHDAYNITCVVDEFGGTAGILTLEDILEEIFGEIEDEHDEEDYVDEQISDTEYLFSGRLELDSINDKYANIELPAGDFNTLSGYIVMTLGDIPKKGEQVELDGYRFIFESVSKKKIETVRIVVLSAGD